MSFRSLLDRTCTIQEKTVGYSDTGSPTKTWANKETNVKCSIQTLSGEEASQARSEKLNVTHFMFFEFSADVIAKNKIIENGVDYIVKRVDDGAGRGHHKEILAELST